MKPRLGLPLAFLLTACGAPPAEDPRHADIVVESPELGAAVLRAAAWWSHETGNAVAFEVVAECAPDHVCERVRTGVLPADKAGLTAYPVGHPEDVTTTVSADLPAGLADINVAHELGHVLGLGHTDGVMTEFIDQAEWALPSEWRE